MVYVNGFGQPLIIDSTCVADLDIHLYDAMELVPIHTWPSLQSLARRKSILLLFSALFLRLRYLGFNCDANNLPEREDEGIVIVRIGIEKISLNIKSLL